MRKTLILLSLISTTTFAQTEMLFDTLRTAVVSANRSQTGFEESARSVSVITQKDIQASSAQSLNELLEFAMSTDMRQRGVMGAQADLSIRGSGFDQCLVLINGIKMSDPQTGHHQMNLALELGDIERIEIIHGGASRIHGPNAFAGAINIITKNAENHRVQVGVTGGDYGYFQAFASATLAFKNHSHRISYTKRETDGYIPNSDLQYENIFWQSEIKIKRNAIQLMAGQNNKAFGAQNFYTSLFPDQYEATRTQFAAIQTKFEHGNAIITPRLYYRRHFDRFELFRETPDYYIRNSNNQFIRGNDTVPAWYTGHNYHRTDVRGAEINALYSSKFGKTSVGADYRHEQVLSNVLGKPLDEAISVPNEHPSAEYTRKDWRENISLYVEHNFNIGKLFVSGGTLFNMNSAYGNNWFPGIDVSYKINKHIQPYASVNKSLRFPTFTDLYYNRGGAQGSIDLKPEESLNYELGTKMHSSWGIFHIAAFRREGKNLIDWIRYFGSNQTVAANVTTVNINGVESSLNFSPKELTQKELPLDRVQLSYTYMWSDTASTGFQSNYVLDFLQHKFDLNVSQKISEHIHVHWNITHQQRRGEFVNASTGTAQSFKPFTLVDFKIKHQRNGLGIFAEVANLFNVSYIDIGNIPQPGRWMRAGISYQLDFKKG